MGHGIQRRLLAAACLAASLSPGSVMAADADESAGVLLEEVVVTARFRKESIRDMGVSVSALSSGDISKLGIQDFDDVGRFIAGMQNVKSQQNANNIAIRGVIDAKPDALYSTSSVYSVFLDDVSVAAPGLQRDYSAVDLNRIEVIRGPQPTLFGEGAVGGVIRYFTNDPDLDGPQVTGYARAQLETIEDGGLAYSGEDATSIILVPGELGLRVSGFYRKDEGFIDNPTAGEEDVNDFDTVGGRAVLLARPVEDLEIRLAAFAMRDDLGEATQVDPGSDPEDLVFSASPVSGDFSDDFDLFSGRVSYDFGPLSVTSITGYYKRENAEARFSASNTFGLAPFFASDTPGNAIDTTTFQTVAREQEQLSQEFRFVSNLDGAFNFTGGLYYREKDITESAGLQCAGCVAVTSPPTEFLLDQNTTTESTQYSAFLEGTLDVTERLRLIAGARYINDEVVVTLENYDVMDLTPRFDSAGNIIPWTESDPIGFTSPIDILELAGYGDEFEFKLSRFLPRLGMEFDLGDDTLFYANAAVGARNGGVGQPIAALSNSGGDPALFYQEVSYDEDSVKTLEGGIKSAWLDGDLSANIGVFHSRFKDTQILVMLPASNVTNGPDQRITGLELESKYRVTDSTSLFFNATLLDTEFTGDFATTNTAPPGQTAPFYDLTDGNEAPQAPTLSYSLGYSYTQPLESGWRLTSNGVFQYIDERYSTVQNYPSTELASLEILNFRIGLENDRMAVNLFANNLLNDIEAVRVDANVLTQSVGANGVLDSDPISASVNRPRSVGVNFTLYY